MFVVRDLLIVLNVCFVVGWRWLGERGGSICVCVERENVLSPVRAYPAVDGKLKTNNKVSNEHTWAYSCMLNPNICAYSDQSAYSPSNSFFFHSSFILLFSKKPRAEPFNFFLDIR